MASTDTAGSAAHITVARVHLDRLRHNVRVLREAAGGRPMWPAVKANAYGHGLVPVARELLRAGCEGLCVAHVCEAEALRLAGITARILVLSATLPEHAAALVRLRCEPSVATRELVDALATAQAEAAAAGGSAERQGLAVHVMVDTGMGRVGIRPDELQGFLAHCRSLAPAIRVAGVMSHFPCADAADKGESERGIARFDSALAASGFEGSEQKAGGGEGGSGDAVVLHISNSAAILDLPDARFGLVRPGIATYGLRPSADVSSPRARELKPVLEWKSRITFLKEVAEGTPLSYGHTFRTTAPSSVIATVPVGYGDGLSRTLSNRGHMLVHGIRCPIVGRVTMDQCLLDVSAAAAAAEGGCEVALGDEVVIIGRQGGAEITADELAATLDTINYEITTTISARVNRVYVDSEEA